MTFFRLKLAIMALGLGTLALSGCATLSEGECRTADWYELGRQDGGNGMARARLYKHREACAEYGVRPRPERYYAGRDEGLKRYCTARNGFDEGRAGHSYRDVCPGRREADFLAGYRQGKTIYAVDSDVDDVERAINRKEHQLSEDGTSGQQRRLLRRELHSLDRELRYLNRELIRLQRRSLHTL